MKRCVGLGTSCHCGCATAAIASFVVIRNPLRWASTHEAKPRTTSYRRTARRHHSAHRPSDLRSSSRYRRGWRRPALLTSSRQAILELHNLGACTLLLSGDNPHTAEAIARQVGIDEARGDTAIEIADVALMDDDLRKIPAFVRLSRRTAAILKQNIVLALGIKAVFADMGASLIVVANGLRLIRPTSTTQIAVSAE